MTKKTCSTCKHAVKRFNNGNGATTCGLLGGMIVVHSRKDDVTPAMCPYLPDPIARNPKTMIIDKTVLTKENFSKVVLSNRTYCSAAVFEDTNSRQKQPIWRFVRIVEIEDEVVIFEVKTVEDFPRRITMASQGEGWHREIWEVIL